MTIAAAILTLLGVLVPVFIQIWKKSQTPKAQLQKEIDENDQAIVRGDVNLLLDQRLRSVQPKGPDHSRRSDGDTD